MLDDKVLVDYSVLGRAVLGDDSYDAMTLKKFLLDCREDRTLWQSLSLSDDPKYNFKNLLNLNEVHECLSIYCELHVCHSIL